MHFAFRELDHRAMDIDRLNRLSEEEAADRFRRCCAAARWVECMVLARPFENLAEVLETSGTVWAECDVDDYLEAFEAQARTEVPARNTDLAAKQVPAGELTTDEAAVVRKLNDARKAYAVRFEMPFIASATGRSPQEMLAMVEARMGHDPGAEVQLAADEMEKLIVQGLKRMLI